MWILIGIIAGLTFTPTLRWAIRTFATSYIKKAHKEYTMKQVIDYVNEVEASSKVIELPTKVHVKQLRQDQFGVSTHMLQQMAEMGIKITE